MEAIRGKTEKFFPALSKFFHWNRGKDDSIFFLQGFNSLQVGS